MLKHFRLAAVVCAPIGPLVFWFSHYSIEQEIKSADGVIDANLRWLGWVNPPGALASSAADHYFSVGGGLLLLFSIVILGSWIVDWGWSRLSPKTAGQSVIPVFKPYCSLVTRHRGKLGDPLGKAVNSRSSWLHRKRGAHQAWTEKAHVIWMRNPGIMIAFGKDGNRLASTQDYGKSYPEHPELWDESYIRRRLGIESGPFPRGSLAFHMIENPEWDWLGKFFCDCVLDGRKVYSQRFEHGTIYGPFRANFGVTDTDDGMVFVAFDDGTMAREATGASGPKIIERN